MTQTPHNDLRDAIARDWQKSLATGFDPVLSVECGCGESTSDLLVGAAKVQTEYTWQGKRPDIAVLNAQGKPTGFAEVIDTSPPSSEILALYRQSGLPVVFIPWSDDRTMRGFCSVRCWDERAGTRRHGYSPPAPIGSDWGEHESLLWCEDCGVRLTEREAIGDCTGIWCPSCIGASIIDLCCWGRDPLNNGRWPSDTTVSYSGPGTVEFVSETHSTHTLAEKLALWNSTDFWRFVWNKRVYNPQEPTGGVPDERLTRAALQFISTAIACGEWSRAYHSLLDVGYKPMTAWEPSNCLAAAQCWEQIEAHVESLLPDSWEIVRRKPEPVICDCCNIDSVEAGGRTCADCLDWECGIGPCLRTQAITLHRGFSDGRYTACGIDRWMSDQKVAVTQAGAPTCEECK